MPSIRALCPGALVSALADPGVRAEEFRAFWDVQARFDPANLAAAIGVDMALFAAAASGDAGKVACVASLLPLRRPEQGGQRAAPAVERALCESARRGQADAVAALVALRDAAVRADCDYGLTVLAAGESADDRVADAPFLDRALQLAAGHGHADALRVLLAAHQPGRRRRSGIALAPLVLAAIRGGDLGVLDEALALVVERAGEDDAAEAMEQAFAELVRRDDDALDDPRFDRLLRAVERSIQNTAAAAGSPTRVLSTRM